MKPDSFAKEKLFWYYKNFKKNSDNDVLSGLCSKLVPDNINNIISVCACVHAGECMCMHVGVCVHAYVHASEYVHAGVCV